VRSVLFRALRITVAAGLTGYILWKSHPRAVLAALVGADWRFIAIAVLLVLGDRALIAYRWVVLLCIVDPSRRPPLAAVLRVFFVSSFVGTFLPTVGGDAFRAYSTAKLDVRGGDAVASVFMDRILGVASILIMALIGLLFSNDLARNSWVVASLAITGGVCLLTLLLVFSRRTAGVASAILAQLPAAVQHAGGRMLESIGRYARYRRDLANGLVCSVAVQVIRILQAYYIGRGLGIAAGLTTYFAIIPLILLIILLPVTFNGIGTGQAAFLWFFGRVGVMTAAAFTLSVLYVALGIVGNLPGGILYAMGRTSPTAKPDSR
jgi:glycosyltransferase 2 family protein